ncbi:MAG: ATP-binding cassette domain-containing protein [Lachnospiraceae bacterium]|nr:ATP-binding cassette domain-containing protein [Lachnospiraceae bacterium]
MSDEKTATGLIEIENVTVSFKQKKKKIVAVKDASLTINEGEIVGIIGSSGAGKSTLLRTINRLQGVSSGRVLIGGQEIEKLSEKKLRELRNDIGMIFQHFNLIGSKDVYSNIEFVLLESKKTKAEAAKRIDELLRYVGIEDKKHAYPAQLSGGQKQRVAIARALANEAKILLCDEPTSALDAETTEAVLNLLKQINKELGVTIVIITHELDVVKEICDRVAVMNGGEIVETADTYKLFTEPVNDFTKNLIQKESSFQIPRGVLNEVPGKIIRIDYYNETAERALINETIEKFGVKINILHGKIDFIKNRPLGVLFVSVDGDPARTREAYKFIKDNSARTEVLRDA